MPQKPRPRTAIAPVVEELDPRILFSADVEALAPGIEALVTGQASQQATVIESAAYAAHRQDDQASATQATQARVELVFVDMSVPEAAELVAMLGAQADGERSFEIIQIDPARDGLQQITAALAGRQDIAAVHIVSHGDAGGLQLGSTRLDAKTLAERAGEVVGWSDALGADADLMLYGCDLAAGAGGRALIDDLAMLTGADVAASTDRTGSAMLGADWVLEYRRGSIEAAVVADAATQAAWQGALATVTFQEGVGGYTGTQDTMINPAATGTSYGSSTTVLLDDDDDIQGLIRFDNLFGNGAGQIPLGSTITSATLYVYVNATDAGETVSIYRMLAAWSEASTWASLSGGVSNDGVEAASASSSSIGNTGSSGFQSFGNLAATVQAWANGETNNGWVIKGVDAAWGFYTSEYATAANRPYLSVTYTPPQAPVLDLDANNSSGATGTGYNASWTENGGAVAVADSADASLTDSDSSNLTGLTVTITNATDGTAEILAATTTGTSINASYNSSTHVLTLSGTDTVAHYQQVLRTVTYNNTSENPSGSSRSIGFVATDAYAISSTATATVAINAVNDAPVITSNGGGASASVSIAENTTAVTTVTATDAEGATLTYSISGGADAAKFSINSSTGVLTFASAPDFENPTDAGGNNVYDVIVQVSDGSLTDTQAIAVTVTAVNDNTPVITSNGGGATASVNVAENATAVTTVTATDADLPAQTLTYSIVGGADQALFTINASTGALAFASARDRENATDANADGIYEVTVQVSDGSLTDSQAISVTVTAVNDNTPVITSNGGGATASVNVAENATAVTTVTATDADLPAQTLTYSIVGGADQALFTINASTGALAFVSGRDRENATDADADGVYEVTVQVSDGSLTDTQAISVTVTAVNDNTPTITSNGGGATASVNVAENATAVTTVTATDADLPAQTLTYSIVGGADQALFTINASTGALAFVSGRDRENASDADADGVYEVTVQVSDGSLTDTQAISVTVTQAISVTVTAVNDNTPTITSNGGGATASVSVAENTTAVTTVTASDADLPAQTLTYSIVGGADQALFTINASTGALAFVSGRDRENPTDADADGVYEVTVQVSDGSLADTQAISVTVTAVNDNAPAITSNGGGATASVNVAENATAVTTVTATDADLPAQTLIYSIVGGADQALFTINASTGALSFASGRDRENATDADADGVYEVTVQVSDGSLTDTQTISVTVTAVNDNTPTITSNGGGATASVNVAENATAVTTVTATDADLPAQTLIYSIVGGADQALFTINASTGALAFVSGRDRENATDADADGVYEVTVQVSDGSLTDTQAISVTVNAVNDNTPTITSDGGGATASVNVAENATAVTTVTATDADLPAQTLTYSIVGGADQALFTINASTGALAFVSGRDRENATDADADGVYEVTVQVSDGSLTDSQAISVTVTAVNDNTPVITSNGGGATASVNVAENTTAVTTVTATDADLPAQTLTYSIVGGADQALFTINASTGALAFVSGRDRENATDADADGVYEVTVQVSDGSLTDTQAISVTVTAVNDNTPAITSDGGGATASVSVAENTTAVTTVTATDADLPVQTLTYSIIGGADQALFTINASTGALAFASGRDFESATDADGNGVYEVTVQVSDGSLTDTQAISVTVTAVNDNTPTITSNGGGAAASVSVAENATAVTTVTATDADLPAQTLTYSIVGGADQALFTINASTGALAFVSGRDRENTTDTDADGVYEVTVQVSDGSLTDTQAISVTVTAVNDNTPTITSNGGGAAASVSVAENTTAVTTVTATDADLPAQTLTYSIVGGADQALFTINASTGALAFVSGRDRENATDANADGVYEVTVQVSDGSLTDSQAISVTVTAVNDNTPVITSNGGGATASVNVAENATAVTTVTATDADLPAQTLTYSIVGGADQSLFTINASTGALAFVSGRDRENATDADADGVYEVTVQVSDGSLADTQAISVTVTAVNDNAPVITSNGAGSTAAITLAQNTAAVTTVVATDADLPAQSLTYSIAGGADAGQFTIDAVTGALSFLVAPAYASPADAGGDNVYDVIVQASDGSLADTQAIAVTIVPTNDHAPAITSDGGGATASVNVAENTTAVTVVAATDADLPAQTLVYSIAGGADQALFTINATTGALSFTSGRDFEGTTDADGNGVYEVVVQVSDGSLTDTQAISVTVTAVNDNAPVITSNGGGATASVNVAENTTAVTTVTATDADLPTQSLTYSIVGGADQSLFTINTSTGALAFVSGRDRENATDADADGVYEVTVQVSDGSFTDSQAISVTVTAVNDNTPVITSNGGGATASVNVAENATAVTTVTATDADLPAQTLTYSIVGGADQALFTINASTGALAFVSGRDRENATDADADGVYEVTVQVSDGSLTDTQAISVTVTAVNDNTPVITSNGGGATASVNVAENARAVTTVTATDADLPAQALSYSIVGGADQALFTIDAGTGALSFVSGRDRENATDADADGVYEVTVQVSDGSLTDTQAISVTVTAVNDNTPVITSNGGGATASINVAENTAAVTTVSATDADLPAQSLTYSIVGGADQALFTIDASTGALAFVSGRDRENATDADADGVYEVTVQASDGSLADTQAISVTVTALNDNAPVITSNGGGATAALSLAEGGTAVATVHAADADLPAQSLTYAIVGGADQALFSIDAATGVLSFLAAPDFENPSDSGADNVYDLTVRASDGSLFDTQALSITVTNVNEAPAWNGTPLAWTLAAGQSLSVDAASGLLLQAADPDGDAVQAVLAAGAAHGQVLLGADGSISYQPDVGYAGGDSFSFLVSDGSLGSSVHTVSLTVQAASPPPPAPVPEPEPVPPLPQPTTPQVTAPAQPTGGGTPAEPSAQPGTDGPGTSTEQPAAVAQPAAQQDEGRAEEPGIGLGAPGTPRGDLLGGVGGWRATSAGPAPEHAAPSAPAGYALAYWADPAEGGLAAPEVSVVTRLQNLIGEVSIGRPSPPSSQDLLLSPVETTVSEWAFAPSSGAASFEIQAVEAGGIALSTGVVWWAMRLSGLLLALSSSAPAWRSLDPLPVVDRKGGDEGEDEDGQEGRATTLEEGDLEHQAAALFDRQRVPSSAETAEWEIR